MDVQTISSQSNAMMISQSAPRVWAYQASKNAAMAGYLMQAYAPISLAEMDRVALMKRVDTKYVLHVDQLFQALGGLQNQYRVLSVQGNRISRYHNVYFDTPDFMLYYQHHNERSNRYKVRSRQYVDSGTAFLEIKHKNNREITIKSRIKTPELVDSFSHEDRDFLSQHYPFEPQGLHPVLTNDFMRITLVSRHSVERLTLDINLQLSKGWYQIGMPMLAVAEVKQEHFSLGSDFVQQMRTMNIMPQRFSKYCLGITQFYPQVKHNRFKPRNLMVARIMGQGMHYGYTA
jgi:VTC domain-containing protein